MPVQTLLKPQSSGGNIVESSSEIKYADGGTFQLKIESLVLQAQCALKDCTGEADNFVTLLHTGRVSGQAVITGHVISGKLVGFNNLPDDDVLVHAVLGKTGPDDDDHHLIRFKMAVTGMTLQYSRKAATIPITIEGKITKSVSSKSIYEIKDQTISAQT